MVYKALSLVLAILIVSTGCAGNSGPAGPSAGQQETKPQVEQSKPADQTKPAAQQAAPAAAKSQAPSGSIVSAVVDFGEDSMDPKFGGASNGQFIAPMFEGLVLDDGTGHLAPCLAESYSMSSDAKAWTFKIRKGIKFHNGDELTAADVKFSFERLVEKDSKNINAGVLRTAIDSIATPDSYTVVFNLKSPSTMFDSTISSVVIMPQKYITDHGEAYYADHPVGTGPWKFVKHDPGVSLELEAVENHWRITPAFKQLIIKLIPQESTRMAMLKRGDVDIIDVSLDGVDEAKAAGAQIVSAPYFSGPAMYFDGTYLDNRDYATQDIKVRQALFMAVNRDEIAKSFFKGYAEPSARLFMAPYNFGYDPSWKPEAYDPQKAKQLLADAGYPGKFKEPVITVYSYAMQQPWLPQFAQIVSGYWEAIGAKTKIVPVDYATVRGWYIAKPFDPKLMGAAFPVVMPANPTGYLTNSFMTYGTGSVTDLLKDAAWDDLYSQINKETDQNKRAASIGKLYDQAYNHYAVLSTVNVKQLWAVGNKIGEWKAPIASGLGGNYERMQHK